MRRDDIKCRNNPDVQTSAGPNICGFLETCPINGIPVLRARDMKSKKCKQKHRSAASNLFEQGEVTMQLQLDCVECAKLSKGR
jgi:hypothetical protein